MKLCVIGGEKYLWMPVLEEHQASADATWMAIYSERLVTVLRARLGQRACSDEALTMEEWAALGLPGVASGPHPWRWQGIRMEASDGR